MANIVESSTWEANVYLIDTSDPVQGGTAGIDNKASTQLANRSQKLKDELEANGIFISASHAYMGQNLILSATIKAGVVDGELVFRNTVLNQFEKAIADGTANSYVIGIADVTRTTIISNGLVYVTGTGGSVGDTLYLSSTVAGAITTVESDVPIGKYLYDDIIFISASGVGGSSSSTGSSAEYSEYHTLLADSYYRNLTFDLFETIAASDPLLAATAMTYDVVNTLYNFTVGQTLTSTDLFDSESGLTVVTEAMISVNYTDSGTPTIEATADGGANWETVENNTIHTFTDTGDDLRLRFTAGGTGTISSWGIFYRVDTSRLAVSVSGNRVVNFNYAGEAQDEDEIINGIYFNNRVGISHITINGRVAPIGADITIDILKDDVEETNLATLSAGDKAEKTTLSSIVHFDTTEKFGLIIKSVGSTEPGQELNITIHYYDR